jgi:hypothetical protein
MTSRRILEFWESNRSVEFRRRLVTDRPPSAGTPVLIIRVNEAGDYTLDGHDVEELHQWTFEILAGVPRDPRLDAQIMCGAQNTEGDGQDCALVAGHANERYWDHVAKDGTVW